MRGFRRYAIVAIGALSAGYGFTKAPLDQQAVADITTQVGALITALLALWSALRPSPAAGTIGT